MKEINIKDCPLINKFTIRSLKLNIKRTIATCIGIILSTALICAVAGVFSSFQQTLIERTKQNTGDYHAVFYDVPKNEQKYILENRNVESYYITQGIGYSILEESKNDYKPYLYLMEFDKTALNNFGLTLEEGRMPENKNELVISRHIETNGGVKYNVKITSTGQGKLSLVDLAPGNYTAVVSYKGNAKYNPASATASIIKI